MSNEKNNQKKREKLAQEWAKKCQSMINRIDIALKILKKDK
jgi:hypothetical protein